MSPPPSSVVSMSGSNIELEDTLLDLVVQYGLPAVLQTVARIMARRGSVTGGIVGEAAGIEGWLATRPPAV
jgi:hypothetical protein